MSSTPSAEPHSARDAGFRIAEVDATRDLDAPERNEPPVQYRRAFR